MTRLIYKPRLKKGIFKSQIFLDTTKNFSSKKLKWRFFLKKFHARISFFRNELFVINEMLFDYNKSYKLGVLNNRRFFSYFATIKKQKLKKNLIFKQRSLDFLRFKKFLSFRLDFILIATNLVKNLFEARWLIFNGFVLVNGNIVISNSYALKSGDFVLLKNLFNKEKRSFFRDQNLKFFFAHLEICFETFSFFFLKECCFQKKDFFLFHHFFDFENFLRFHNKN